MKYASLLTLLFITISFWGQNYPKDYFIFPINPGQQSYLAGTFGELRSNHFHSGIDIKTGGKEGLDVLAAAEGFVSRIKIGRGGYGKTLYIDHPNGYTTVYAHLQKFIPEIDSIIRAEQYRIKSYEVNFFPERNAIRVNQRQKIAISGNTGGSSGPHLHFEIRNHKQEPVNPLYFGFTEITDHISPSIRNIAFSPLDFDSRINGRFDDVIYNIKNNSFDEKDTVFVQGKFHINIDAIDKLNGARNNNGIARIEAQLDGNTFYNMIVDQFSFGHTRMLNEHINYRIYKDYGRRYYKLKFNNQNKLGFYKTYLNNGELQINDNNSHQLRIIVYDNFENTSTININIKRGNFIVYPQVEHARPQYEVIGHTMKVSIPSEKEIPIRAMAFQKEKNINPAYRTKTNTVYLIDLNTIVPNKVTLDSTIFSFPFAHFVHPGKSYYFRHDKWKINIPKGAFYNSFLLTFDTLANGFRIGDIHEPVYKKFNISSPKYQNNDKLGSYSKCGINDYDCEISYWKNTDIITSSRDMGEFQFLIDSIPPTIEADKITQQNIVFKIDDNLSGIGKIEAYLNGNWLLMNYDYKTKKIWAEPLKKNTLVKGDLSIEISDNQGNIAKFAKKIP